ncbi:MAG TPA: mechanosensitive ion channel [Sphingomicrobium sp.]|nr:mechanosensitive ion channel [Sphingomicrobium sp.]
MYDTSAYWQAQLMNWGPKVLIALLILVATWIVARAVKWVLAKAIDKSPTLRKQVAGKPGETLGSQLGTIAKLIIWLVGIMAALTFLGIGQILAPVNRLLTEIFEFLPRLIGAGLIFFIGLILARILRQLTEAVVSALNIDRLLVRMGLDDNAPAESTGAGLARAFGILAFAIVIIPAAIAAFEVLQIDAISRPAINMLNQILAAIPHILTAALWIGIAFVLGRFVKTIVETVLPPTGFDEALQTTGVVPATASPSRIVGTIAMIAIILAASIEAAKQLGGGTIAIFLAQVTELGGKVIFGTLIIVVGIFLARIIGNLVGSGTGEGGYAQTIVRYAIIALFTAIGLTFMGLADTIVMMAFGLILGSAAVATALAFGLGGRDAAARVLERWSGEEPPRASPAPPRQMRGGGATREPDDSQPPLV